MLVRCNNTCRRRVCCSRHTSIDQTAALALTRWRIPALAAVWGVFLAAIFGLFGLLTACCRKRCLTFFFALVAAAMSIMAVGSAPFFVPMHSLYKPRCSSGPIVLAASVSITTTRLTSSHVPYIPRSCWVNFEDKVNGVQSSFKDGLQFSAGSGFVLGCVGCVSFNVAFLTSCCIRRKMSEYDDYTA